MVMHWVYVLKNDAGGNIYVGETTRLYRRWHEHQAGRGGINTSNSNFNRLIGLYKVPTNTAFLSYRETFINNCFQKECEEWELDVEKCDATTFENLITEQYMFHYPEVYVRGGKYTIPNKFYNIINANIDRPLCHCGYPCEVKIKIDKTKVYFVCPLPAWDEFYDGIELDEPCNFWQEFKEYRISRDIYITNRTKDFYEDKRKLNDIRQIFADTIETGPAV
jgi:predicted GIY-YIG superfamily endonuclease